MNPSPKTKIVIIGGGFGGLNAAKDLDGLKNTEILLIDRRNHHLFQPLLYQVAMAGLNPSDIAIPLRKVFSKSKNITVILAEVSEIDLKNKRLCFGDEWQSYDKLIMACGSKHSYFGKNEWEKHAPGLKTLEQATEIRRRVLMAFELAEREEDKEVQKKLLTFVVIGGGPTGVELAGAISEMAKRTLYKDYKKADLRNSRVILVETGDRVLKAFPENLSRKAKQDLEKLGVEVILNKSASELSDEGLKIGDDYLKAYTILWAAGVQASSLGLELEVEKLKDNRIKVEKDLSLKDERDVFVIGDQAAFFEKENDRYLPGLAPVAIQQGKFVARMIENDLLKRQRETFNYFDKGIMATIGRAKAVVSSGKLQLSGLIAWMAWAFIHILYLVGFRNRFFVILQWFWSYFKFGTGARLIVHKKWQIYSGEKIEINKK